MSLSLEFYTSYYKNILVSFFPDIADIPFSIKFPAFYRTKAFIQDFPGAHSASAESSIAAASPRLSADIDYPGSYSSDGTDRRPALRLPRSDVATADTTVS